MFNEAPVMSFSGYSQLVSNSLNLLMLLLMIFVEKQKTTINIWMPGQRDSSAMMPFKQKSTCSSQLQWLLDVRLTVKFPQACLTMVSPILSRHVMISRLNILRWHWPVFLEKPVNPNSDENKSLRKYASAMRLDLN